ncbi:hypothetical protein CesoFtcFv8_005173 [Champsocephalus esox]|uniref:Proprotein convertase subtilisin/kexin type 9 n=1 Tax=Champsocephalus esox TaxID=159716 RepID=A0AAN8CN74_9TELE|nr:hypothetical protein CesoFtcFv8_005173 [Champsocephalus esox]
MRRTSAWVGWVLCLCTYLSASAQDYPDEDEIILDLFREDGTKPEPRAVPTAEFLKCNKAAWRVHGQYLVVLRQGTHGSHVQRTIRRLRAKAARRGQLLEILHTYSAALHGFMVKMSSDVLHLALKLPQVHYIEEDSSIFAQSAPWNLQRLLQPHGGSSENGTYRPPNDGGMALVYLLDGSVQSSHREIEGRVLITDFNSVPEEDGVRVHRQASQCDSHGTHIAGVVSGSDSGVARGAGVNLVRVLNCQGKGTVSGALAGLEYIQSTLLARPVDAVVVLLPFSGGFSRSLNAACRDMVAKGAVVIASAGNYRDDACLYSPASEPEVITVGAVNSVDQLMSQGAGGHQLRPLHRSSGTSQAAAHAAGIAAVILSSNQNVSPVQVMQMMLHYSISHTINFLSLPDSHRLISPNLVAAMPPANSANEELLCRSVWSKRSGVTSSDQAVSRCRLGEEMMSCSSSTPDGVHAGETISESSGQMECVAFNALGGKGVYAVARCCVIGGLQCQVHASPECVATQHHLTGCTLWSAAGISADSRPHGSDRRRRVGSSGATSHAVCCHAPSLECHLLEKISADKDQVEVSCPSGWTLTDCSAVSPGSVVLAPVAKGNSCHVGSASGAGGSAGVAVCCRVRQPEQRRASPHP